MAHLFSRSAALAVLALAAVPAAAQYRPYVAIENAKIGFPPGRFVDERDDAQASANVAKFGQWAPISFDLKVIRKLDPARGEPLRMRLRVECRDADGTKTTVTFPIGTPLNGHTNPADPLDTTAAVNAYLTNLKLEPPIRPCVRPGGDVTLTVTTDGDGPSDISESYKVESRTLSSPSTYVVLTLGSKVAGFDLPGGDGGGVGNQSNRGALRNGRVLTAAFDDVRELPDHWFAYEGADLIVLATADARQGFLEELFDPQRSQPFVRKREALLEWVRRGGKLLVSVGREADTLKQFPAFLDLLPVGLTGRTEVTTRDLTYTSSRLGAPRVPLEWTSIDPKTKVERRRAPYWLAKLEPKAGGRTPLPLMRDTNNLNFNDVGQLLVAQTPFGMGRITVTAFDLDVPPFRALPTDSRAGLWDWLIRVAGSEKAAVPVGSERPMSGGGLTSQQSEDGALAAIRWHTDEFEGVPVISFGWVALFILLYTLLIGPVEYLFLKKIMGRLELTWVTFPVIVLSVSAAAYFTAYAIKGKDLRINKIDVVDIDLAGKRVYGRTWFTVFSPRVDNYSVGVEPRTPWAAEPTYGDGTPTALVDWVGGVGSGQNGARGFRDYKYQLDETGRGTTANGLLGVPIQVWSTKAFSANWSAPFDAIPPVTADLKHLPASAKSARGTIATTLPLDKLQEGYFLYAGQAYKLDALPKDGTPVRFDSTNATVSDWATKVNLFDYKFTTEDRSNEYRSGRKGMNTPVVPGGNTAGPLSLWGVLLHDKGVPGGQTPQNSTLRPLDQSWRLDEKNTEEVMIIVKLPRATGPAEQLMSDPAGPSPSKLWLRGVPGLDAKGNKLTRTEVPGILQQETYVRIFIPVQPATAK